MRAMLGLSCALLSSGCSFIFSDGPPPQHQRAAYFDCSSNAAAPATDVVNALGSGLLAGASSKDDPNTSDDEANKGTAVTFGIIAAVYTASAIYGFVVESNCSAAKEELALRLQRPAAPQSTVPTPPAPPKAPAASGCSRDVDCKAARICVNHACVDPGPPERVEPAPAPAPLPTAPGDEPRPVVPLQSFPELPPAPPPAPPAPAPP
jgi:hypothetical protein